MTYVHYRPTQQRPWQHELPTQDQLRSVCTSANR